MELRDIEYFAVVAEHGHLGRAAATLGLTQPALSKSLRRLEQALQVKLVQRTPKGVVLTVEGDALLQRVRELRLSLRNVAREIEDVSRGRIGRLRIGVGGAISQALLSSVLATQLEVGAGVRLEIDVSDNDRMMPALDQGELDVVVNYIRPAEGLLCEPLYKERFVVVASARHRLAASREVALAALTHDRWALPFSQPTLVSQRWLHQRFLDAGLPPPAIAFEARSAALRMKIVARSDLLTFASASAAREAGPAVMALPVAGSMQCFLSR
jgi:DNA-binding transcriptional LysR family regulator